MNNERVRELLYESNSWSEMSLKYGQKYYSYDDNFKAVSNYALNNIISIDI